MPISLPATSRKVAVAVWAEAQGARAPPHAWPSCSVVYGRGLESVGTYALSKLPRALLPVRKASNIQRDLIRSIAALQVMIEQREMDYANTGTMADVIWPWLTGSPLTSKGLALIEAFRRHSARDACERERGKPCKP